MGRLGFVDGNVFHPPSGYSEALLAIQLSLSPPPPPPCLRFRPVPRPQGPGAILLPQVPPHPCDLRSPPPPALGTARGACWYNFPSLCWQKSEVAVCEFLKMEGGRDQTARAPSTLCLRRGRLAGRGAGAGLLSSPDNAAHSLPLGGSQRHPPASRRKGRTQPIRKEAIGGQCPCWCPTGQQIEAH